MKLSALKTSLPTLLGVLGLDSPGQHRKCPFHEETRGSLSVYENDMGQWRWKCHAGCGGGTVVDAVMLRDGVDAKWAMKSLGVEGDKPVEKKVVWPVLDMERAKRLMDASRKPGHNEAMAKALEERAISESVARVYGIGYVVGVRFEEWHSWRITGWVIPVYDAKAKLLAIKIHRESPPKGQPKCLWTPYGTVPKDKPKHGANVLYPPPEVFGDMDRLWLVPGELKALAMLSTGVRATSPTVGEGTFHQRHVDRIAALTPRPKVSILYDDDEAGRRWKMDVSRKLGEAGILHGASKLSTLRGVPIIMDNLGGPEPETDPFVAEVLEKLDGHVVEDER